MFTRQRMLHPFGRIIQTLILIKGKIPPCPPLEKGDTKRLFNKFPPFIKGGLGGGFCNNHSSNPYFSEPQMRAISLPVG